MKLLIVDIERTGLSHKFDAIVEIALVLVDTKTGEIKKVFDNIVKHEGKWNPFKHKNAWIFKNSNLKVKQVSKAKPLENYKKELQDWFDKYKVTAFNLPFDSRFLEEAGFKIKKTKCLMLSAHPYSEKIDKRGARKRPSVKEIYNQFFMKGTEKEYIEEHRAGADAMDEAKILLHIVDLKKKKIIPAPLTAAEKKKYEETKKIIETKTSTDSNGNISRNGNYPIYKPIGPKDKFPFGKHKDKIFEDLVKESPKYIKWCVKNVKGFSLTPEAEKLLT